MKRTLRNQYLPVIMEEGNEAAEKNSLLFPFSRDQYHHHSSSAGSRSDSPFQPYILWFIHAGLLLFSLSCLSVSLLLHTRHTNGLGTPYFPYSPAQGVASYQTERYNITPVLERTKFVGYGPEVDAAWDHVTYDVGDQMLTQEELERLGLDPSSLKVADPRTGKEGYRAGIQVFHKLHCLNLLRQSTYGEYYSHTGGDIDVEAMDLRGHLDHCLEILRKDLMCQSDIGVYTFKSYEGFDGHWPDFSTLHTCRNFDAIRDWAFENAVVFGDEE